MGFQMGGADSKRQPDHAPVVTCKPSARRSREECAFLGLGAIEPAHWAAAKDRLIAVSFPSPISQRGTGFRAFCFDDSASRSFARNEQKRPALRRPFLLLLFREPVQMLIETSPWEIANFVSPATLRMFNFFMMRSRCVSTVRTPTPSWLAISLLLKPSAI
jgi:hypothetical protein